MSCEDVLVESSILEETFEIQLVWGFGCEQFDVRLGKILTSGDLIIWRDSAECGDGKDLVGLTCDGEFTCVWELDEELFELAGDFKLDAITVCA